MTDSYDDFGGAAEGGRALARAHLRYEALEAITIACKEAGLSRSELAERLGVTKSAVSQLLNGDRDMRLSKLADCLHAAGYLAELHLTKANGLRRVSTPLAGSLPTIRVEASASSDVYRVKGPPRHDAA